MKKRLFIIFLLLLVVLCSYLLINKALVLKTYKEINFSKLEKMIDNKEDFVLFIGSEECSHCKKFKKTINRIVEEYQIKVYYIDILKLDEEENAFINAHFPYSGTPTTIVIKDGVEYERQRTRIEGAKDYEFTVERLTKAGIIKG